MTDHADVAGPVYYLPDDPNTTRAFVLCNTLTCLGRLMPGPAASADAWQLQLNLPTTSMQHPRIVRTEAGYVLQNWQGRYGIGLYERELRPGESPLLTHCDVFR